ncbi:MAG: S8 family serine peptidase, partial [Betaproteobacteria bacterium]
VIDTGRTSHPDLDGRLLPGYDFISDAIVANDGDGRDADPSDAGDWINAADKATTKFADCTPRNSSWHGTLVAGVIGASTQNGRDTAGIDWAARIVPVRVLGKCGGTSSDTADGMMWAAGMTVPGIADNPNPAKVLNLSLGGQGSCSNTYRNAINQLVAAGKIIVVSAGNENTSADESPASCPGVINVAATARSGSKASYSSFGSKVTLSAPGGDGGDLVTLGNTGTTVPVAAAVVSTSGTSFSAPVVTGVVSLMLAIRPDLDSVAITRILTASVRPFPDTTCDTTICGAGIIDAAAALRATRDQSIGVATFIGFQDADIGRPNPDVVLKVTNLAGGPATIGTLQFSNGEFSATANTCANIIIGAGGSCNITIRFNPAAKDTRQGELVFTASDGRIYRVSLAGFAYPSAAVSQRTAGTGSAPLYIAKAPDGNYWYTQPSANRVARMTPAGGVVEYTVPTAASNPFDIVAGADGNIWFTELDAGRIGRITLAGTITEFPLANTSAQPRGITAGPDGNIWFTEITTARIGRITPQGTITEFDIPWTGASPRGITAGPDGNLWFTDSGGLSIGRVTPQGAFTRFTIPWVSGNVRSITTGPDRNLWFTELTGDRLGRITTAGAFTEFPLPRAGDVTLGISAGPDGSIWYTANGASRVGRIDTVTGQISEYRLPSAGSSPAGITIGPNNVMWVATNNASVNKIAMLSIAGVSGANVYSDMWWAGTAENGWGMSIQQHGLVQLNAIYVYDAAGKPIWYVLPGGAWNADYSTYSGAIYQPTSAPLNSYSASQFNVGAAVGNISINFTSDSTATLQYTINGIAGQKSIQRQVFGRGTSPLNVGDMWWGDTAQNGWGVSITQQQGILFAAWYTYGADGKATWYVMTDGTWTGNTYTGAFFSTVSSPWLGTTYTPSQLQVIPAGTMTLNFSDANNATMTYAFTSGPFAGTTQTKPIVRQPY